MERGTEKGPTNGEDKRMESDVLKLKPGMAIKNKGKRQIFKKADKMQIKR